MKRRHCNNDSAPVDKRQTLRYIYHMVKWFEWNEDKNSHLKAERDISFEEIVFAISDDRLLALIPHSNQERYPGQMIYIVEYNDYAYLVPFVVTDDIHFLKTIIPSRKATRQYLRKLDNE